jgi:hypothetical protein
MKIVRNVSTVDAQLHGRITPLHARGRLGGERDSRLAGLDLGKVMALGLLYTGNGTPMHDLVVNQVAEWVTPFVPPNLLSVEQVPADLDLGKVWKDAMARLRTQVDRGGGDWRALERDAVRKVVDARQRARTTSDASGSWGAKVCSLAPTRAYAASMRQWRPGDPMPAFREASPVCDATAVKDAQSRLSRINANLSNIAVQMNAAAKARYGR